MKKNLLFASLTIFMAHIATSCKNQEPTTYPNDLIGFWSGTTGNAEKWYGLDVLNAQNASFITYYSDEDYEEEAMTLTYDATTGKGKLVGDGKTYTINATSDITFTITMVDGTILFKKSTKPVEKFSLTGYWKQTTEDFTTRHLLFYPKNEQDSVYATIIEEEIEFNSLTGYMAKLVAFDYEKLSGSITLVGGKGTELPIEATDFNHLTFSFFGIETAMTKQARLTNVPKTLQGTWSMSSSTVFPVALKIVVDENNQCHISYTKPTTSGVDNGTAKAYLHYCPRAGMGGIIPTEYDQDDELAYLFEGMECGIFYAKSATEISIPLANLGLEGEVTFTKQ